MGAEAETKVEIEYSEKVRLKGCGARLDDFEKRNRRKTLAEWRPNND
jgi:hypothetical protein